MAQYQYDEGGNMAAYLVLTFLSLILIPSSFSFLPSTSKKSKLDGCQCSLCVEQRERIRRRDGGSLLNPKLGTKAFLTLAGWALFAYLAHRVITNKTENVIYDPFEILGITHGTTEKEIKSHYKKLSRQFHPDKVKLAVNQTMEQVSEYFVTLTKAYKSLTDETIRKNLELYGHPDGRQELSMGIAIPSWLVEGNNKFGLLIAYCLVFGGVLPVIVGRWWFGSRSRTKDGVIQKSAEVFFRNIKEDSNVGDLYVLVGRVLEWEYPTKSTFTVNPDPRLGEGSSGAKALLDAHVLRTPIMESKAKKDQEKILFRTPIILSSLLNVAMAHNWLIPTLNSMRLHAYLAQAVPPSSELDQTVKLSQLPGLTESDAKSLSSKADVPTLLNDLQTKGDPRAKDIERASQKLGALEVVDAFFKVAGERVVTPGSFVQLIVKLRIRPSTAGAPSPNPSEDAAETQKQSKYNQERDDAFIASRKDGAEEIPDDAPSTGYAHAPYWPANRRPSWWIVLGDAKTNRFVVPPLRVTDVPFSDPSKERNYRAYKLQFQVPTGVGLYTWKLFFVGDTYLTEEVTRDITLKIDDPATLQADEQGQDDDISEPEEDSIAGQMALMRGGNVKKSPAHDDSDDDSDESGTDDDGKGGDDDSSSDSD